MDSDSDVDSQMTGESDGIPLEQPKPPQPAKPLSATEMLKAMIKKEVAKGPMGQQLLDDEKRAEEQ